jgi:hypothetical protein
MTYTLYVTHYIFTAINEHKKHKLRILRKRSGREISDIVKNYDYSFFHLPPTFLEISFVSEGKESEKDRQIGKGGILWSTDISSLLLHHPTQRQNKSVSKFHHFNVKKNRKNFFHLYSSRQYSITLVSPPSIVFKLLLLPLPYVLWRKFFVSNLLHQAYGQ